MSTYPYGSFDFIQPILIAIDCVVLQLVDEAYGRFYSNDNLQTTFDPYEKAFRWINIIYGSVTISKEFEHNSSKKAVSFSILLIHLKKGIIIIK